MGVSSVDGETPTRVAVDPATGEVLVQGDLSTSDIQIGAVEIKNSTDDTRATVGAGGLSVDLGTNNDVTVTGSVTANATLAAETTKVIGTVNLSAAQTLATLTGITNNVNTVEVAPTTIYNGKKTVTTATTRVALASSQAVKSVTIKALIANTGTIYVGDSTVAAANGFALVAGDSISLDIGNLATIYLDSSVDGEGVTYISIN